MGNLNVRIAKKENLGGCNFCNNNEEKVAEITGNHIFIRMCKSCVKDFRKQTNDEITSQWAIYGW